MGNSSPLETATQVIATPGDWRAMTGLLAVLLIIAGGFIGGILRGARIERDKRDERFGSIADRLAVSVDGMTEAIQGGDAQAMANMAVIQNEMTIAARQREQIARDLRDFNRANRK